MVVCSMCGDDKPEAEFGKGGPHSRKTGISYSCKSCQATYRRERRKLNPSKFRGMQRRRYHAIRKEALMILGGTCKCGISDYRVLQINHKNGGGRKELETRRATSFYIDIVRGRRDTSDLEVTCANCNILYEYERGTRMVA